MEFNNVSTNYLDKFNQDLRTLLDGLRVQATVGGSLSKFAEANATSPNFQTPHALVQCILELSVQDCIDCLVGAIGDIPTCRGIDKNFGLGGPNYIFIYTYTLKK